MKAVRKWCLTIAAVLSAAGLAGAQTPALKRVFKKDFRIGAALNPAQFTGRNAREAALVRTQFNSISPENVLKWERVHPEPGVYRFADPDAYVAFGEKNHMFIVGHTLVWHNQTPKWVFEDANGAPLKRDALLARMRDHIRTVVGRYKGRIGGWDVVNEALNEDGTLRQSSWLKIIGPDYIEKAFEFAHQADPKAELYYNDYNIENPAKREGAIRLIRKLQAEGIPIAAVGIQGHYHLDQPSPELVDAAIAAFSKLGIKVNFTELDIDLLPRATRADTAEITAKAAASAQLNPYANGLPDASQQELAKRYASLFAVFLKHKSAISRVTFWGVTDADSWLNNWPVPGRTSYPLLFDRECRPKAAFYAVIKEAQGR
jgi:endo-1,4-beta-xylanase